MIKNIIKAVILSLLLIGGCTAIMFNSKTKITKTQKGIEIHKKDTIK